MNLKISDILIEAIDLDDIEWGYYDPSKFVETLEDHERIESEYHKLRWYYFARGNFEAKEIINYIISESETGKLTYADIVNKWNHIVDLNQALNFRKFDLNRDYEVILIFKALVQAIKNAGYKVGPIVDDLHEAIDLDDIEWGYYEELTPEEVKYIYNETNRIMTNDPLDYYSTKSQRAKLEILEELTYVIDNYNKENIDSLIFYLKEHNWILIHPDKYIDTVYKVYLKLRNKKESIDILTLSNILIKENRQIQIGEDTFEIGVSGKNGLISPDGKFYQCDYHGHNGLAMHLIDALGIERKGIAALDLLERLGWIHISEGKMANFTKVNPTQAQIDTLFDWAQSNFKSRPMPIWIELLLQGNINEAIDPDDIIWNYATEKEMNPPQNKCNNCDNYCDNCGDYVSDFQKEYCPYRYDFCDPDYGPLCGDCFIQHMRNYHDED